MLVSGSVGFRVRFRVSGGTGLRMKEKVPRDRGRGSLSTYGCGFRGVAQETKVLQAPKPLNPKPLNP